MAGPSPRFPIAVNLESVDGTVNRARLVNAYVEVADANSVKVYTRPGLTLANGSFAAFGMGMAYTPTDQLFVVSGGNIYTPSAGRGFTVTGTQSHGRTSPILHAFFGGTMFGYSAISDPIGGAGVFNAYKSVYPFTSWSTIGTGSYFGTNTRLQSRTSYASALTAWSGTTIYYATDGTSFTT